MNRGLLFVAIGLSIANIIDTERHNKKMEERFPPESTTLTRDDNRETKVHNAGIYIVTLILIIMMVDSIIREGF